MSSTGSHDAQAQAHVDYYAQQQLQQQQQHQQAHGDYYAQQAYAQYYAQQQHAYSQYYAQQQYAPHPQQHPQVHAGYYAQQQPPPAATTPNYDYFAQQQQTYSHYYVQQQQQQQQGQQPQQQAGASIQEQAAALHAAVQQQRAITAANPSAPPAMRPPPMPGAAETLAQQHLQQAAAEVAARQWAFGPTPCMPPPIPPPLPPPMPPSVPLPVPSAVQPLMQPPMQLPMLPALPPPCIARPSMAPGMLPPSMPPPPKVVSPLGGVVDPASLLLPPGRASRPDRIVLLLRGLPGSGKSRAAQLVSQLTAELSPHSEPTCKPPSTLLPSHSQVRELEAAHLPRNSLFTSRGARVIALDDYFSIEDEDGEMQCAPTRPCTPRPSTSLHTSPTHALLLRNRRGVSLTTQSLHVASPRLASLVSLHTNLVFLHNLPLHPLPRYEYDEAMCAAYRASAVKVRLAISPIQSWLLLHTHPCPISTRELISRD